MKEFNKEAFEEMANIMGQAHFSKNDPNLKKYAANFYMAMEKIRLEDNKLKKECVMQAFKAF